MHRPDPEWLLTSGPVRQGGSHATWDPMSSSGPRHARSFLVDFLANERELRRKTFTAPCTSPNPDTLCEIHFPVSSPLTYTHNMRSMVTNSIRQGKKDSLPASHGASLHERQTNRWTKASAKPQKRKRHSPPDFNIALQSITWPLGTGARMLHSSLTFFERTSRPSGRWSLAPSANFFSTRSALWTIPCDTRKWGDFTTNWKKKTEKRTTLQQQAEHRMAPCWATARGPFPRQIIP